MCQKGGTSGGREARLQQQQSRRALELQRPPVPAAAGPHPGAAAAACRPTPAGGSPCARRTKRPLWAWPGQGEGSGVQEVRRGGRSTPGSMAAEKQGAHGRTWSVGGGGIASSCRTSCSSVRCSSAACAVRHSAGRPPSPPARPAPAVCAAAWDCRSARRSGTSTAVPCITGPRCGGAAGVHATPPAAALLAAAAGGVTGGAAGSAT